MVRKERSSTRHDANTTSQIKDTGVDVIGLIIKANYGSMISRYGVNLRGEIRMNLFVS